MSFHRKLSKSLVIACIALALAGSLLSGYFTSNASGEADGVANAATNYPLPAAGKAVSQELSADQTHSYKVSVEFGQYLRAMIESQGTDVSAIVLDPGGNAILKLD